jgi:hypothetical protein
VLQVTHHEVVIRWDTHADESVGVPSDLELSRAWHRIAQDHINLPSMAETLKVTSHSWTD